MFQRVHVFVSYKYRRNHFKIVYGIFHDQNEKTNTKYISQNGIIK